MLYNEPSLHAILFDIQRATPAYRLTKWVGKEAGKCEASNLLVPALLALLSDAVSHPSCWVLLAIRVVVICWWKSFVCV